MRAFVNFNKENPTESQRDAELDHLDPHTVGLVASKGEPLFCEQSGSNVTTCRYNFLIQGDKIHSLDFLIMQSGKQVNLELERQYVDQCLFR